MWVGTDRKTKTKKILMTYTDRPTDRQTEGYRDRQDKTDRQIGRERETQTGQKNRIDGTYRISTRGDPP